MKAALYARVLSEEQVEGYSVDAQKRAFKTLVEGKDWTIWKEYIDEGKSARTDNINKRPAFKEMVVDALDGNFDVLVVHKLDCFARNLRITLEYFDKLSKVGISFVSINENMDFSTPWGRLALTLLGGLAQFYSDNLSQETKKGWAERRAQGLYCGLLPFGAIKGDDGTPIPNPDTYPGLVMAFELAAQGKSDREVAQALNTAGYRTTGNQGYNLFSKDTIRGILNNKFYLGYLPDGNGGWLEGKHEPFIDEDLWDASQEMRMRNRKSTHTSCRSKTKPCSLSGIVYCWYCKGRMHIGCSANGKSRLSCFTRAKGQNCCQPSALVSIYEAQMAEYIKTFHIPENYQEKIMEAHSKLQSVYDNVHKEGESKA